MNMKKIAIASALTLMAGVASAQVVVGGTIRYDMTKADGSASTTGIAKSEVTFRSTEDLGNGIKVTAGLGLNGAERGATVTGTDAFIAVATPAGEVMVGQVEVANGLLANTQGLTPVQGSEGIVLGATANYDVAQYTSPAMMGFKATATALRGIDATDDHTYVVGVEGKVGPVAARADYTDGTERVRVSGQVNVMGVAVGAGWSGNETGVKDSWIVAAAVPVGPVTVGATYANGNGKATAVAAKYALSKRTSIGLAYRDVTENSVAAKNVATTRVRLQHTF